MEITARVHNNSGAHKVSVSTNGNEKPMSVAAKPDGRGSAINGGELLFLALATCFCNDVYREAAKRNLKIDAVEVTVSGKFGAEGEPASDIRYYAHVTSASCTREEIQSLVEYVDDIAEIHRTLRQGIAVKLETAQ